MIRNNAKEFGEVASQQELLGLLDEVEQDSKKIVNTFLQENLRALQDNVDATRKKIQAVKKGEGGTEP